MTSSNVSIYQYPKDFQFIVMNIHIQEPGISFFKQLLKLINHFIKISGEWMNDN